MFEKEDGFTLIELLIALVVLSFGIIALVKMQAAGIGGNVFNLRMSTATFLAEQKMEELQTTDYTDATLTDTDATNNPPSLNFTSPDTAVSDGNFESVTVGPTIYTRIWNIADNDPVTNVKKIAVIVSWVTGGRQHNMSVVSLKTQ